MTKPETEKLPELPTPWGYARNVDGRIEISVGPIAPPNRSGGYATPWAAMYGGDMMQNYALAALRAQGGGEEMSPEFTDTSRAALAWVLYHHQGGSSPVGQPIRFALGMGQHERLNDYQLREAKRWAALTGATTADFHNSGAAPDAAPDAVCHWSMTDDVYEGETWNSDCGVKYCFIEGGPADNGHQFCHCCGKALIAHARSAGGEDGNR